jgi:electron transfer flavoprotein alpha subunit
MAHTDVIIVCEAGRGQTESANARLISMGGELARHSGGKLVCILAGHGIAEKAAELSCCADEVFVADSPRHADYSPYAHMYVAQHLVKERQPLAVLFGHTYVGMDLAPRLAARLGTDFASNCFDMAIEADAVYFMRPMYRGRIHAKVAMDYRPMIATIQGGAAEDLPARGPGAITSVDVVPEQGARTRVLRTIAPAPGEIDIAKADVVVAGGRGIGERENFRFVSDLAEALGGVAACSRPLVDMGWCGVDRQVGLSGNTVKPKIYVACGISGAVEHVQGMKEAGMIVAINKDPEAPIFRIAHCGVVGDLNEILPRLAAEIRAAGSRTGAGQD